ncbi:hypothetical protein ACVW16_005343 [Bradyrhizobium sp. USDA 4474]
MPIKTNRLDFTEWLLGNSDERQRQLQRQRSPRAFRGSATRRTQDVAEAADGKTKITSGEAASRASGETGTQSAIGLACFAAEVRADDWKNVARARAVDMEATGSAARSTSVSTAFLW